MNKTKLEGTGTAFNQKSVEQKWHYIFKDGDLPNLKKIVSIFLSIYTSNAFVEGIFSKMNSRWTDEKAHFILKPLILLFLLNKILDLLAKNLLNISFLILMF